MGGNLKKPSTFRAELFPILLATGVIFGNMLPRAAFSPLLLLIEQDLGISHTRATKVFLYLSIGSAVSMFFSGVVSSWLTHRWTIIISAWTAGMSLLLVTLAPTFSTLLLALVVFGMANGLYPPSGMATITSLVRRRDWGKAIALHEVGPNLTMVAAPVFVGLLSDIIPWQSILRSMALVSLAMGTLFAVCGRGGRFRGSPPRLSTLLPLLRRPAFWVLLGLLGTVLSVTSGIFSILPTFLVTERGMDLKAASALVGFSRLTVLVTIFASGWVVDHLGAQRSMSLFLIGTAVLTIVMGLTNGVPMIVAAFLQPVLGASFFPAALSALSSLASEESRNLVYSATFPIVVLVGGGVAPSVLGFLGDQLSFSLGIVILGGLALAAVPAVRWTRA